MTRRRSLIVVAVVALVAIALIAVGLAQGEELAVYRKAMRICLECIGIG